MYIHIIQLIEDGTNSELASSQLELDLRAGLRSATGLQLKVPSTAVA
jgi:hypothetical protein